LLKNIVFTTALTNPYFAPIKGRKNQLSYCGCNHSWQQYNQSCYAHYGIQCPPELSNARAQRHCEFIAGRYCAIRAIQRLELSPNSTSQTQIPIQPDRRPLWPLGIIGSISHSGDRAMAVIGSADNYIGLGIDCEIILTESAAVEIADLILDPLEKALLLDQQLEYGLMLTLVFSAKESLFKALSPSLSNVISFHDLSICSISESKLVLRPTTRLNGNWFGESAFSIDYIKQSKYVVTMAAITA
jgi:4'-phosphopantetheinyl transferase EntD